MIAMYHIACNRKDVSILEEIRSHDIKHSFNVFPMIFLNTEYGNITGILSRSEDSAIIDYFKKNKQNSQLKLLIALVFLKDYYCEADKEDNFQIDALIKLFEKKEPDIKEYLGFNFYVFIHEGMLKDFSKLNYLTWNQGNNSISVILCFILAIFTSLFDKEALKIFYLKNERLDVYSIIAKILDRKSKNYDYLMNSINALKGNEDKSFWLCSEECKTVLNPEYSMECPNCKTKITNETLSNGKLKLSKESAGKNFKMMIKTELSEL